MLMCLRLHKLTAPVNAEKIASIFEILIFAPFECLRIVDEGRGQVNFTVTGDSIQQYPAATKPKRSRHVISGPAPGIKRRYSSFFIYHHVHTNFISKGRYPPKERQRRRYRHCSSFCYHKGAYTTLSTEIISLRM